MRVRLLLFVHAQVSASSPLLTILTGEDGRSPNFTEVGDEQELQQSIQEVRRLLDEFSVLKKTEQWVASRKRLSQELFWKITRIDYFKSILGVCPFERQGYSHHLFVAKFTLVHP